MSTRRKFLRKAAVLSAAPFFVGGLYGCKNENSTVAMALDKGLEIEQFGIQLWTVRDFMANDVTGTLKDLGAYGYKQIESFQGDQGVFWGLRPKEFSDFLGDHGMSCISAHCDSQFALDLKKEDEFKKMADDAASIGIKHLINPFLGNLKTIDEFKEATDGFNRLGAIANKAGLRYAYHNHHYSFKEIDGVLPQDLMMSGTDPDLVDFEMDIYWVVEANHDPVKWLEKYPNRFKLCHIKDRYEDTKVEQLKKEEPVDGDWPLNVSCVLGQGKIDFDKILDVAKDQGMEQWIVEQERYDEITSMEAAKADAIFMKRYS